MDQTNERLVFDRIVHNCCEKADKPQYFLVTPKLLHGLRAMDDDQVTVLLVFNGPGITNKWQLGKRYPIRCIIEVFISTIAVYLSPAPILNKLKAQRSAATIGQGGEGDEDGEEEVSTAGARKRAKEASNTKRAATESSSSTTTNAKRSKVSGEKEG